MRNSGDAVLVIRASTRPVLSIPVLAVLAIPLPMAAAPADDSRRTTESDPPPSSEITNLIHKAIAARDAAARSISTARGRGRYTVTVTDKAMNVIHEERAAFQMVRDNDREFIQFRYDEGAGYDDPDVYARVVLTDGTKLYESVFCRRIHPTGAEATVHTQIEHGSLQPLVWISGNLANYYSFLDRSLKEKPLKLSMRDEDGMQVLTFRDDKHMSAQEFWVNPRQELHLVRYRIVIPIDNTPTTILDVRREWRQADKLWYVRRCVVHETSRKDGVIHQTTETELVFDVFEQKKDDIPAEVFSVHALGLPDDSPIWLGETRDRKTRYVPDPNLDLSALEKIVGTLPMALPPQ